MTSDSSSQTLSTRKRRSLTKTLETLAENARERELHLRDKGTKVSDATTASDRRSLQGFDGRARGYQACRFAYEDVLRRLDAVERAPAEVGEDDADVARYCTQCSADGFDAAARTDDLERAHYLTGLSEAYRDAASRINSALGIDHTASEGAS